MRKMTYTQAATCDENLKVRVTPEQSEKMQKAWFAAGKQCKTVDTSKYLFLYQDGFMVASGSEHDFNNHRHPHEEIELIDEPQHEPEYTIDELINMRGVYFWVNDEQSKEFKQKWKGKNNLSEGCNYYIIITEQGYLAWESESLKHHITERLVKIKPVAQKSEPQHDFASQQEVWEWIVQGNNAIHSENSNIVGFKDGVFWDFTENRKGYWQFFDFENWQKYTSPRLIRVNGVEVPAPLESLDGLKSVWIVVASWQKLAVEVLIEEYPNPTELKYLLKIGMLYATKEDAIKRAEAMLKFEMVE